MRQRKSRSYFGGLKLLVLTVATGALIQWLYAEPPKLLSPLAEPLHAQVLIQPEKVAEDAESLPATSTGNTDKTDNTEIPGKFETDDLSSYISQAVQEFLPKHKSESLMIMHCLAHRENGHGANRNCGDSGRACGPFQFWQETWNRMRGQMVKEGVASEIGDRYDRLESARTAAWAISKGHALEWGPILRDSKGSNYAACQTPSWYSKGAR